MDNNSSLEKNISLLLDDDQSGDDVKELSPDDLCGNADAESNSALKTSASGISQDGAGPKTKSFGTFSRREGKSASKVVALSQEDIDNEQNGPGRNRLMIIMVFVLSAVLGVILMRSMGFSFSGGQSNADDAAITQESVGAGGDVKIDWDIPNPIAASVEDFGAGGMGKSSNISVRGIIYSRDYKSAIIGKDIVGVGDEVMGAKIISITRSSVEFSKNGVSWKQSVE